MRVVRMLIDLAAVFAIVSCPIISSAQEQNAPPQNMAPAASAAKAEQKVFVFVQRTDRHAKYSSAEVFHNALSDILDYLKAKNVAVAVDEFGGRNHAEGATPLETVFSIARESKATSVMYVVVDRPVMKWIQMTVQCFDMDQKQLWQEKVSSGGGLSGKHGFEVSIKKLHTLLDKHVGRDGLPVAPASQDASTAN